MGALPALYAATEEHLTSGESVGPGGVAHARRYPAVDRQASAEYDRPAVARLWEVSESLTGVTYDLLRQQGVGQQGKRPEITVGEHRH